MAQVDSAPVRAMRNRRTARERIRWRIVFLLGRLPGQCWTDLVSWALDGMRASHRRGDNPLPWRPVTDVCRKDARGSGEGRCFCGKVRSRQGRSS